MKVSQFIPIQQISTRVTDKSDKQGGAGQNAYERQKKKDDENEKGYQATEEEVNQAIEVFAGDETNLAHGITAESAGNGPGLKVMLKDSAGGILRSVSGEEFLKLREAVNNGRKSGRILDQKA
jgi:hypothetical protein